MTDSANRVASEIVNRLEQAWNAADGDAWAAEFADDATFVTVRGDFFQSRATIAQGHHFIFSTIYKGSTNKIELLRTQPIGDDLILAHSSAELAVPAGPMAGTHRGIQSLLLVRVDDAWRIANFHNTFTTEESLGQMLAVNRQENPATHQP